MVAYGERTVAGIRRINASRFELTFTEPVDGFLQPGSYLDNLDCQPDLVFTGNRVANNRARSLICSTAGKVRISGNHFEQPVSENIEITGDANFWFESGPVSDVTIEKNVFISRSPGCSLLHFGPEEKGLPETAGPATRRDVFHFGPEEKGLPETSSVPFHSNIKVLNNEFYLSSPKLLHAHRVDGLEFRGNTIRKSKWYLPGARGKSMDIKRCRNVSVAGNTVEVQGLTLD
jgi:hypothetical protein